MTLLENLIKVNGQTGGTIHQFSNGSKWENWRYFEASYYDLIKCGIEFPSKSSFDKLAKEYHIKIQW